MTTTLFILSIAFFTAGLTNWINNREKDLPVPIVPGQMWFMRSTSRISVEVLAVENDIVIYRQASQTVPSAAPEEVFRGVFDITWHQEKKTP